MTKDIRDTILIWIAALFFMAAVAFYINTSVNADANGGVNSNSCPAGIDKTGDACNPVPTCPAGTYNVNTDADPVCKNDPTGCVYGDSIPLDQCVDKSAAANDIEPANNSVCEPPTCGGS